MTDYESAMQFLYGRLNYESAPIQKGDFRLQRMQRLVSACGLQPAAGCSREGRIPIVHIAGTKGKGTTASMVAALLSAAGRKTGLYTSPHLRTIHERFRVDGVNATRHQLTQCVRRIRPIVESEFAADPPTFFELTTLLALDRFQNAGCDAIVLEVGLGGRLDSTNVCHPALTAITSIGLDHVHVLGDTHAEIAAEKAGILKSKVPVVCGVESPVAADVIQGIANDRSCPMHWVLPTADIDKHPAGAMGLQLGALPTITRYRHEAADRWGSVLNMQCNDPATRIPNDASESGEYESQWRIPMEGWQVAKNAAIALRLANLFLASESDLGAVQGDHASLLADALSRFDCEARIQRIQRTDQPTVIVDGAHNSDSVAALMQAVLRRCAHKNGRTLVFATSRDKDAPQMLRQLLPHYSNVVLTRFLDNPRGAQPRNLLRDVQKISTDLNLNNELSVTVTDSPAEAILAADEKTDNDGWIVVCGSFFLAGEMLDVLQQRRQ